LVIEGAGGLLVPLNDKHTVLDIIQQDYKVVVVSRHYLGSINHTLLTIDLLKEIGHDVSIIFSGSDKNDFKHQSTERIIEKMSRVHVIGRIDEEKEFNKSIIKKYADLFKNNLEKL
jgi:dethiobiotin synthetase